MTDLLELAAIADDWNYIANDEPLGKQLRSIHAEWKSQVNTLTNERDLAIRANEQNIQMIKLLRRRLRREAELRTPS